MENYTSTEGFKLNDEQAKKKSLQSKCNGTNANLLQSYVNLPPPLLVRAS
jgi:hypothetical protein